MIEMKPCPFCGSKAAELYEADDVGGFVVHCLTGCGAQHWGNTEAEAITAWNTRQNISDVLIEALEAARSWIEHDDGPMGPTETRLHRGLLAQIEVALRQAKGETLSAASDAKPPASAQPAAAIEARGGTGAGG